MVGINSKGGKAGGTSCPTKRSVTVGLGGHRLHILREVSVECLVTQSANR